MNKVSIRDLDLKGKVIFVRVDFNVPVDDKGNVLDDSRIRAALKTINYAIDKGAKVVLASHLDRPKGWDERYSLKPVAVRLSRLLKKDVKFVDDCIGEKVKGAVDEMEEGDVLLLENLRFYKEETANDEEFAKNLVEYADYYVNDAFGTAHRKHASTYGAAKFAKVAAMGFLIEEEMEYFKRAMENPSRPLVAIIGGAKVSTKIGLLKSLVRKVDKMLIGGAMAFTFLKALGFDTGRSLLEQDYVETAKEVMRLAKQGRVKFYLPVDFVVADEPSDRAKAYYKAFQEIPENMMGLDIGPATVELFKEALSDAETIIWNGPMGYFELKKFKTGSVQIARYVASLNALSIVGGGDTDAVVSMAGVKEKISHVSTGGGAFLELLEKGTLPCVEVLTDKEASA